MARGAFTEKELDELNNNPYVIYAENNRIVYSNEFKFRFMKELGAGKRPQDIFNDAGFDINTLGSKRIERATARWKESYAAGTLGNYDDSHIRKIHAENEGKRKRGYIQETIALQNTKIKHLEEKLLAREKEIEKLKSMVHILRMENNQRKGIVLKDDNAIISLLNAKVELLLTVGFLDKDKYDYKAKNKDVFYELIHETLMKYEVDRGITDLCNILGFDKAGYYKYVKKKKLEEK